MCMGLLVARTMTRLASVIIPYTLCQRYSYMSNLEPTLPVCSSGRLDRIVFLPMNSIRLVKLKKFSYLGVGNFARTRWRSVCMVRRIRMVSHQLSCAVLATNSSQLTADDDERKPGAIEVVQKCISAIFDR